MNKRGGGEGKEEGSREERGSVNTKWFKRDDKWGHNIGKQYQSKWGNMYRARTAFFHLLAWDDRSVDPTTWRAPILGRAKGKVWTPLPFLYPAMPEQNTYPNKKYLQQVIPSSRSVSRRAKEAADSCITLLFCLCKQADTGEVNCPTPLPSHPWSFSPVKSPPALHLKQNPGIIQALKSRPSGCDISPLPWEWGGRSEPSVTRTAAGSISRACFSTAQNRSRFSLLHSREDRLLGKNLSLKKSHIQRVGGRGSGGREMAI